MNLKQAINKSGLTQQKVSELAEVSRGTVNTAIQGKQAIRYAYAQKIVDAINEHKGTNHTVESLSIKTLD